MSLLLLLLFQSLLRMRFAWFFGNYVDSTLPTWSPCSRDVGCCYVLMRGHRFLFESVCVTACDCFAIVITINTFLFLFNILWCLCGPFMAITMDQISIHICAMWVRCGTWIRDAMTFVRSPITKKLNSANVRMISIFYKFIVRPRLRWNGIDMDITTSKTFLFGTSFQFRKFTSSSNESRRQDTVRRIVSSSIEKVISDTTFYISESKYKQRKMHRVVPHHVSFAPNFPFLPFHLVANTVISVMKTITLPTTGDHHNENHSLNFANDSEYGEKVSIHLDVWRDRGGEWGGWRKLFSTLRPCN